MSIFANWVSSSFQRSASGGSRGTMEISLVEYPWFQRIKMNSDELAFQVGRKIATAVRKRLRKGQADAGSALPQVKRGGRTVLNDSGKLIRSIKYDKKLREIAPKGKRRDGHKWNKSVGNRNAAIMAVHIHTLEIDPLGSEDFGPMFEEIAAKEIQRQIDRGEFSLVHDMRVGK